MTRMPGSLMLAALIGALLVVLGGAAAAQVHDNVRDGFALGFNVGGGSAKIEVDEPPAETDATGGVAFGIRAGWAFADRYMVGIDGQGWGKDEEGGRITATTSLIAFTWYPGGQGFFLRGGFGEGNVEVTFDLLGPDVTVDDSGAAFGLGAGHEWRLTEKFALGAAVDYSVIDLDYLKIKYTNITAQLNWYF